MTQSTLPQDRWFGLRFTLLMSTLLGFASISTDLFLPALPVMGTSLQANQDLMQYTISAYLAGFSIGQLIWGPVGDKFGRRLPIATGLVLFILGSMGCALSTTAGQLIAFRLLQALGASASVVLARAVVRDLYEREQAAKVLSTLLTVMAIAPLAGPSLGGLILKIADWTAIFWILVAIGIITLAALFSIPETLPIERRSAQSLPSSLGAYASLLNDKRLLVYAAAIGSYYAGTFAYISSSSFAFIEYHHLTPQFFAILFALGIVGLMLTNTVNARLISRFGADALLRAGALAALIFGVVVVVVSTTDLGGYQGLAISLWLFIAMNGFINANAVSGALAHFPTRAGAASALIGAFQYGGGVLGSALAGVAADGTPRPMAYVILLAAVGTAGSSLLVKKVSVVA